MADVGDHTPAFALYQATSSELATPVVADAAAVADALPGADDPLGFVLVVRREMSDAMLADRLRLLVDALEGAGAATDLSNSQSRTVWAPARAGEAPVARIAVDS